MERRAGSVATFEALLRAFAKDPTDLETGDRLAGLADEIDRWGELLDTCEGWLAEGRLARSARLALSLTLARWHSDLDDDHHALAHLNRILAEVPDHLGALEAMAEIFERHRDRALLAEVRARIAEVRRALEADDEDDPSLEQVAASFEELLAGLPGSVDAAALDALAELAERTGRWGELIERCNAVLGDGGLAPDREVALCFAIAGWYARLDHPQDAAAHANRCLSLDPEHLPSLRLLVELYRRHGDERAVAMVEARLRELVETP